MSYIKKEGGISMMKEQLEDWLIHLMKAFTSYSIWLGGLWMKIKEWQ